MTATTFEGLWTELEDGAKALLAEAGEKLQEIEANIVPTIEADIVMVLSQFKDLAIQTVMQFASAEFANMTGQEKNGNVVTTVFQAAEAAGKNIAIQDAQLLAQQAYNAVATNLAPAASQPAS